MREVANFMDMYPAYKLRDVLEEYAVTFFALLGEGYRRRWRNYQILAQISDLPGMNNEAREKFYKQIEWAITEPDDILKPRGDGSSPNEIKKLLGGK